MPLVLDPSAIPEPILQALHRSLAADLAETLDFVRHPRGGVRDPASLAAAEDLLVSAHAVLASVRPRGPADWAAEANLAYASMLAAIDLVKSHTEVPRVPQGRTAAPP
jgi:hypothetical protein